MLALILHQPNHRIEHIQKNFVRENIEVISYAWKPYIDITDQIINANVIIIHCEFENREIINTITAIRALKNYIPIIVMDENEHTVTKKKVFDLGADGYFSQPFLYRVIARYAKNLVFKKNSLTINRWIRAFDLWLDVETRLVKRNKHASLLCNKEFSLLEFLISNRGKVLTRNDILEHVWDRNSTFSSNTVDVHINRLRKKIDDPFKQKLIHTIPCIGYVFDRK